MTKESVFEIITNELERKAAEGIVPSHWVLGIERLKYFLQSGLVHRVDPSSFKIVELPVKIDDEDPDAFLLVGEKIQ
jgi:hypothetical protein